MASTSRMYPSSPSLELLIDYKLVFLLLHIAAIISFTGCKQIKEPGKKADVFYTCSMHPQIMETHPGTCPICGMNLIPVQKRSTLEPGEIKLTDQQIQAGNIRVDTIRYSDMSSGMVLPATLNYDQQKLSSVSSRIMGRVERLYHNNTGEYVRKGDPLLEVYSEELNSAKQEYLLSLERRALINDSQINFEQIIKSARTKLLLWGMSEAQVEALAQSKRSSPATTVYSNESGYITQLNVQEGAYITEGETVMQLADLSTLWAEAQVYASQFSQLNEKGNITVQLPDIGRSIPGKLAFVNPEISPDKRINLLRVTIPNLNGQLKPGMSAYVTLKGHQYNALFMPLDAVLRDSKGASVWIQTGKSTFRNKMVSTGIESGDTIEITSGLSQGEAVVTRGAYLINSEYIFRNGASPMGNMKM